MNFDGIPELQRRFGYAFRDRADAGGGGDAARALQASQLDAVTIQGQH
jgi:hypothetical protein